MFGDSVEELIAFAEKIGMKTKWLQTKRAIHFDLTSRRRADAVKAGAIELTKKTWRAAYRKACKQAEDYNEYNKREA